MTNHLSPRPLPSDLVLDRAPVAILVMDAHGAVVRWNPAAASLFGWAAKDAQGQSALEFVSAPESADVAEQIAASLLAGLAWEGEFPARRMDGSAVHVYLVGAPIVIDEGRPDGAVIIATDFTAREQTDRARRRLELLVEASELLGSALDVAPALQSISRLAVSSLADVCAIDLLHETVVERVAVACREPALAEIAEQLRAYAPDPTSAGMRKVLVDGRPQLITRLSPAILRKWLRGPDHVDLAKRLGVRTVMLVPLAVRGHILGSVMFGGFVSRPPFGAEDLAVAQELARRVAIAVDNANLMRETQAAHRQAQRLQTITDSALSHLDLDALLDTLLQRLKETLVADVASVLLSDDAGYLEARSAIGLEQEVEQHVRIRIGEGGRGRVAVADGPVAYADLDPAELASPVFRASGVRSMLGAPLRVSGEMLGVVHVGTYERREFTDEDMSLIGLAADRVALAVSHARAFEAERTVRQRLDLLAQTSQILGESFDVSAAFTKLAGVLVPAAADWCAINLAERSLDDPVVVAHSDPKKVELAAELRQRFPADPDAETGLPRVLRTGQAEVYTTIPDELLEATVSDPEQLALIRELGMRSVLIIPLVARGRTLGAITLVTAESERTYSDDDLVFVHELADRAAIALDTAMLFQERDLVARTLQRTLLPASLPEVEGVEMAAVYRPAGVGDEVGGDFYDAFEVADGGWFLVVGDVCGKGAQAAALTGLARHTVRAAAIHERRPSEVLRTLNHVLLREIPDRRFCTVAAARLDLTKTGGEIRVCCAGHPPPLVIRASGVDEACGPGTLLGVYPDIHVEDRSSSLLVGDAVVFYTDGVTERRRDGEMFGEERLRQLLGASAALGAAGIVERVERSVVEFKSGALDDDVAVMAAKIRSSAPVRLSDAPGG